MRLVCTCFGDTHPVASLTALLGGEGDRRTSTPSCGDAFHTTVAIGVEGTRGVMFKGDWG